MGLQELCFVELQLDRLGPTSFFFLPLVLQNTCRCCFLIRDGTTFNTILGWPFTVFLGHEFGNLDLNLHRKDLFKTRAGGRTKSPKVSVYKTRQSCANSVLIICLLLHHFILLDDQFQTFYTKYSLILGLGVYNHTYTRTQPEVNLKYICNI